MTGPDQRHVPDERERLLRRLERERRTRRAAETTAERALRRACDELEVAQLRAEVAAVALEAPTVDEACRAVLPRLRVVTGAAVALTLVRAARSEDTLVLGPDVDGDEPQLGRVLAATATGASPWASAPRRGPEVPDPRRARQPAARGRPGVRRVAVGRTAPRPS